MNRTGDEATRFVPTTATHDNGWGRRPARVRNGFGLDSMRKRATGFVGPGALPEEVA